MVDRDRFQSVCNFAMLYKNQFSKRLSNVESVSHTDSNNSWRTLRRSHTTGEKTLTVGYNGKSSYNLGQSICRLFHFLVKFLFT